MGCIKEILVSRVAATLVNKFSGNKLVIVYLTPKAHNPSKSTGLCLQKDEGTLGLMNTRL